MPSYFGHFVYRQWVLNVPKPTASFASKYAIVTGGNSGLGKESAKHLVRLGASKVIIACRNKSKGEQAKLDILSALGCSEGVLEVWELDIESATSVKAFVDRAEKLPRLDVLLNNAGVSTVHYSRSYGTEQAVGVNVIGTMLLAIQLVPKLKETAKAFGGPPHMTFTESALYRLAKYPDNPGDDIFAYMGDEKNVIMASQNQYHISKLMLNWAIIRLSSIVDPLKSQDPNPIVINSVDPMFCKTGIARELPFQIKLMFKGFEFVFARPAEEGARRIVTAASSGRETHGQYLQSDGQLIYEDIVTSDEGVKRGNYVWELLCKKLEKLQPGIMANLRAV
ncbi:hypothetical protein UA08_01377 [Talaromyces atroroseus]|uniref:Short-chain dehydrogenase n=1 Tax=Talaromyces atroroseus TaxID=1441469 RepID=A0A1Q5QBI4_TALAT|nr:hypothetical protein UA08_01377 [Talaromyces atroroseus]OKL63178.1 hypothetical protein UA08_01377 [Talaromyces atroroseus]